jgi:hypothetical protein
LKGLPERERSSNTPAEYWVKCGLKGLEDHGICSDPGRLDDTVKFLSVASEKCPVCIHNILPV